MGSRDPRVDAYIARSAGFAQPILEHLRDIVHAGCPAVAETLKWGMPYFTHHGMLCGMAAFKQHVAFGFWLGPRVLDTGIENAAMGQFGRITRLADLPPRKTLLACVKKAATLNEAGGKSPPRRAPTPAKPAAEVPADLASALACDRKAGATFAAFSTSHRREYIEWLNEAKRADTRARRLASTIEWLAEGKSRNWKYERG